MVALGVVAIQREVGHLLMIVLTPVTVTVTVTVTVIDTCIINAVDHQ